MTAPLGGQSAATETGQSSGAGDQGTGTVVDASGQSAATGTTGTPPVVEQSVVSRAEFDQLRAQLAAADRRRAEAEAAHAQLRDKDMPQMQKLERDLTEAQAMATAAAEANSALRVENAFLVDNTYDWHSPQAALQLLDRSKVTVDDQGTVSGMKDALKALATSHPFMLKPQAAGAEGAAPGTSPPPGTAPANGGIAPQAGAKVDAKVAANRFPAMRQRLGN